jgi:hypothetical protein
MCRTVPSWTLNPPVDLLVRLDVEGQEPGTSIPSVPIWTPDDLLRIAREIDPLVPIDSGTVLAVKILRDAGFSTFESCVGKAYAFAEPTVKFGGDPSTGWGAVSVLMAYGQPVR